ncbi:MAG: hypothetical protein OEX13_20915 [Gammaproteobacteria bacterium]|nr:hypothetical protein [Gammaproteobacteria bacterium]
MLAWIWEESGYLCAARLKAAVPIWLPWVRQRRPLSPTLERQLLTISVRQMDRRLHSHKHRLKRRLYGTTRPGTLLKHLVPIKTDHWDVTRPGYLEIDLVSHSGASAAGEFLHTLDAVDIHTGWVERQAVMGKGQHGILQALTTIAQQLPFALRGLDSDNGSEFINGHLVAFCRRHRIQFTRSRPYEKDDNAHVEQTNWTHVRKLVGWDRYETLAAQQALNALYADLRLFQNLFQPSLKLQRKERRGSRLLRRYDSPQTPFARVRASTAIDAAKVAALERLGLFSRVGFQRRDLLLELGDFLRAVVGVTFRLRHVLLELPDGLFGFRQCAGLVGLVPELLELGFRRLIPLRYLQAISGLLGRKPLPFMELFAELRQVLIDRRELCAKRDGFVVLTSQRLFQDLDALGVLFEQRDTRLELLHFGVARGELSAIAHRRRIE